jgi:hypothetical protein
VQRASCCLKHQASAAWLVRHRRVGVRCLWGGGAVLELASRARGAALAVIGSCLVERFCTGERARSFGARPWCDVPAVASNSKPAPRGSRGAGASVLAVFREETQYSSFLHVRAIPYGCGRSLPCQRALRRRDISSLRRTTVVRRASCGLRLQACAVCLARRRRVDARCLWGRGAVL